MVSLCISFYHLNPIFEKNIDFSSKSLNYCVDKTLDPNVNICDDGFPSGTTILAEVNSLPPGSVLEIPQLSTASSAEIDFNRKENEELRKLIVNIAEENRRK